LIKFITFGLSQLLWIYNLFNLPIWPRRMYGSLKSQVIMVIWEDLILLHWCFGEYWVSPFDLFFQDTYGFSFLSHSLIDSFDDCIPENVKNQHVFR